MAKGVKDISRASSFPSSGYKIAQTMMIHQTSKTLNIMYLFCWGKFIIWNARVDVCTIVNLHEVKRHVLLTTINIVVTVYKKMNKNCTLSATNFQKMLKLFTKYKYSNRKKVQIYILGLS